MSPKKLKKDLEGWRWIIIENAFGEEMPLLTADLSTKKGRELLAKAHSLVNK